MANPPAAVAKGRPATLASSRSVGAVDGLFRHPLIAVFFAALVIRLLLVTLSGLFEGFVLDDGTYHQMATNMAAGDISHWDDFTYSLYWRTAAFLAPVTAVYKLFGPEIVYGQIYVAFIGSAAVVVGTRLAMEFLTRGWALLVGALLVLIPSQAFWSAQLMKDASVWLALMSLALLTSLANRSTGRRLLIYGGGVALVLCALAFLREHTLVVAAWGVMIGSLAGVREQRLQRIAGAIALGIAIPWVVAASGPAGLGLVTNAGSLQELRFQMAQGANTAIVDTTPGGTEEELGQVSSERQRLEQEIQNLEADDPQLDSLRARLEALAARQAAIQQPPPGASFSEGATLEPNIVHLPRGLSVMLLEPFPLPFEGSPSLRLARLESLVWYPLLILALVGLWAAKSHLRTLLFPIIAGGGILLMYALSEGNIGTAHRHRGEVVWVVVLLAVLGLSRLRETRLSDGTSDA